MYKYTPPDYYLVDELLTDEHKIIRSSIRDWVDRSVMPVIEKSAQKHEFPVYLLKELGVQNSSVFLTNATIWVEGITDRLYLRAYMKKYLSELKRSDTSKDKEKFLKYSQLKEDIHYSFVEYQINHSSHFTHEKNE